ncbi:hypothetical protein SADUNF_Sadunf06G0174200 [Salix dunnii]|uniref:Uncharacterized protein n=1 Tax=Salix dunnii TaxID=1413687 RepID=A0A835MXU8_9ROSI|nr:hypothetical protein SADUNF_Sadunf06G0174200 [Salix dunnii]
MASDCISLESVARLFIQGEEDDEAASREFNLDNCLESDQNSCIRIMGDAELRIRRIMRNILASKFELACVCLGRKSRSG